MANIDELLARSEITEQILRYFRAIDRCDRALLESVFHEDSMHDHGPYQGPSIQFCNFALELLQQLDRTMHHAGNILIDMIDSENALSETYCIAYHRIAAGVEVAAFPDHDNSIDEDVWIGLHYCDHWERRNGKWKIAKRIGIHDWVRWAPDSERGFSNAPASQRGQRRPDDRSYHLSVGEAKYALIYRDNKVKPV
jgi:hypothetical protein